MTSCAWTWIYLGAFLMLLELVAPGFILCFVGLAAGTVGVLRALFGEDFGISWQLGVFSVITILYIAVIRRALKNVFVGHVRTSSDFENELLGRTARVTEAIEPPMSGRVLLGDAEWTAVSSEPLAVGCDVKVVSRENLTLRVEPLS